MRIVRLKLKPDIKKLLAATAKEHGIPDPGFVEDIFALLRFKGNGLPDAARIKQVADTSAKKAKVSPLGLNLLMQKRKTVLERLIKLAYFKALCREKALVLAVGRILTTFNTLYKKVRQAQCVTCQYLKACDFGKQYSTVMRDITKVLDPDYGLKVHQDCPFRPEIAAVNQFSQSLLAYQAMVAQAQSTMPGASDAASEEGETAQDPDPDQDLSDKDLDADDWEDDYTPLPIGSGAGKTGRYDNAHTGAHICQVTENLVCNVTNAQLAIFELSRKFDLALNRRTDKNYKPVKEIEHSQKPAHIESEREITQVVSSEHGLPPEVFDARLQKKQLVKRQYQKPDTEKKQLLYMLVDSSGSMSGQLGTCSQFGLFTRASLSMVFCLSLARKIKNEGGIAYFRFFEGFCARLYTAEKPSEFDFLYTHIRQNNYSGGGTDITGAVKTAIADIIAADSKAPLASAEILLITDCDDRVEVALGKELGKVALNVLDVSGSKNRFHNELKQIATKYYKANESTADVNKLVNLI